MPIDRLAQYRIQGIPPAAPPEPEEAPPPPPPPEIGAGMKDGKPVRVYAVDTSATRPQRVTFIRAEGIGHAFPYSAITEIAYAWKAYSIIQIEYGTTRLVKITGRELKPICDALINGTASFIAEQETDEGPSVKTIEIIRPRAAAKAEPEQPAARPNNAR
jgi:hypothetical protein